MRKLLGVFVCLSVLLYSAVSFAYTVEVREHVPEKYLLVAVYGADPDKPIDEDAIRKLVYSSDIPDVVQLQIAVYDEGKHFGEGIRAIFGRAFGFQEWRKEQEYGKSLAEESELGFSVIFGRLFTEFSKEPVASKAMYTNKRVTLYMKIERIAFDASGTPYIEAEMRNKRHHLIARAYLSKDDPFLAKHKVRDTVGVHGRITDFSHRLVTLKGKIIDW